MAADPQTNTKSSLFQASLRLYRMTIKKFRPAHVAVHRVMTAVVIPLLETMRGFKTMPDDPFWFRLELLTGRHEAETTAQLRQLMQPGMVMLDVGAHVGYYTRMASNLVGDSGKVVAFEPHPRNHQYLEGNTAQRQNVTRLQIAVAEAEGTAELHDYLMMSASGSLNYDEKMRDVQMAQLSDADVAPRIGQDFQPKSYTVRTAPIDLLLDELGIQQVDVIKMDIEGAEIGALRGMQRTIQQSKSLALVMEYNPLGLTAFGHDPVAALREVLAMGFTYFAVIEADGNLTPYPQDLAGIEQLTAQLTQHMGVVNILFRK